MLSVFFDRMPSVERAGGWDVLVPAWYGVFYTREQEIVQESGWRMEGSWTDRW